MVRKFFAVLAVGSVLFVAGCGEDDGENGPTSQLPACPATVSTITVANPEGGATYHVGDVLTVKWCRPAAYAGSIKIGFRTTADGVTHYLPTGGSIGPETTTWDWTIQATILGESVISQDCYITVEDYNDDDSYGYGESAAFSIAVAQ